MWKVAIITVSNRASSGEKVDESGPAIQELIQEHLSCEIMGYRVLPDCIETLKENMIELVDRHRADLVLTIGGTGVSPEDVTPEATRDVIDRAIPGMAEEMRRKAMELTRYAMITRALCGTRGNALIINLPGSLTAAKYCLESIMDQLDNAMLIIHGKKREVFLGGENE